MTGWLIAGGVVVLVWLLGCIRLGMGASHMEEEGVRVWVRVGPAKITLYPRPKKKEAKPHKEKPSKPAKEKKPKEKKKTREPLTREQILSLVRQLIPLSLEAAGAFRRKLSIDVLELRLVVGEPDPADAALHYGQASAALGALWGPVTSAFQVKDGLARVDVDFQKAHWALWGRIQMTLTIGQLTWLGLCYGAKVLNIVQNIRKETKHPEKGGLNHGKAASS